jgi:hypothetical protein
MLEAESCLSQILTCREEDDRVKLFVRADIFLCCRVPPVLGLIERFVYPNTNKVSQSNTTLWSLSSMLRVLVQRTITGQYFTIIKKET